MKPDLKAMYRRLDQSHVLTRIEAVELLAYAEKLEAVAQLVVDDRIQEYDEPMRDALRAAGWEV
jgi:hypothetical protein